MYVVYIMYWDIVGEVIGNEISETHNYIISDTGYLKVKLKGLRILRV